jgi:hypothetical protein
MKHYEFTIILSLDASSEDEAKEVADNIMQNLNEMMGHSPHSADLGLEDDCTEVEYIEEDE